jgi:hypothetical protein
MNQPKKPHGGSRKGAGRKKGIETKTIAVRIRSDWAERLKAVIKESIERWVKDDDLIKHDN